MPVIDTRDVLGLCDEKSALAPIMNLQDSLYCALNRTSECVMAIERQSSPSGSVIYIASGRSGYSDGCMGSIYSVFG